MTFASGHTPDGQSNSSRSFRLRKLRNGETGWLTDGQKLRRRLSFES